jgi:adenosylmethionine-8-amino-7-oxononanoate aminotransferase
MTGFGKTGKNFASDYIEIKPDVICLSKALTAGMLPMGATTCSQRIFDAFYDDEISKGLFHGHTYTANPLACAAALAGIELLTSAEIQGNIQKINQLHLEFEAKVKTHPSVENTRCLGTIFALDLKVEMSRYGNLRDKIYQYFMENGVYLRPLGKTIYIACPYVITEAELKKIQDTIFNLLEELG